MVNVKALDKTALETYLPKGSSLYPFEDFPRHGKEEPFYISHAVVRQKFHEKMLDVPLPDVAKKIADKNFIIEGAAIGDITTSSQFFDFLFDHKRYDEDFLQSFDGKLTDDFDDEKGYQNEYGEKRGYLIISEINNTIYGRPQTFIRDLGDMKTPSRINKDGRVYNKAIPVSENAYPLQELMESQRAIYYPFLSIGGKTGYSPDRYKRAYRGNLIAMHVDIDHVPSDKVNLLVENIKDGVIPTPNIMYGSGDGVHLIYILSRPVHLNNLRARLLTNLKLGITRLIHQVVHLGRYDESGITQGYAFPGTLAKDYKTILTGYILNEDSFTLESLNGYYRDFYEKDVISENDIRLCYTHISEWGHRKNKTKSAAEKKRTYQETARNTDDVLFAIDRLHSYKEERGAQIFVGSRYRFIVALCMILRQCHTAEKQWESILRPVFQFFCDVSPKDASFTEKDFQDALSAGKGIKTVSNRSMKNIIEKYSYKGFVTKELYRAKQRKVTKSAEFLDDQYFGADSKTDRARLFKRISNPKTKHDYKARLSGKEQLYQKNREKGITRKEINSYVAPYLPSKEEAVVDAIMLNIKTNKILLIAKEDSVGNRTYNMKLAGHQQWKVTELTDEAVDIILNAIGMSSYRKNSYRNAVREAMERICEESAKRYRVLKKAISLPLSTLWNYELASALIDLGPEVTSGGYHKKRAKLLLDRNDGVFCGDRDDIESVLLSDDYDTIVQEASYIKRYLKEAWGRQLYPLACVPVLEKYHDKENDDIKTWKDVIDNIPLRECLPIALVKDKVLLEKIVEKYLGWNTPIRSAIEKLL